MTKIREEFSMGPNWEDKEWMTRICSELRFKRNKDTLLEMEILEVLERGLKERRVREKEVEDWDKLNIWDCCDKTK